MVGLARAVRDKDVAPRASQGRIHSVPGQSHHVVEP
ncbi:hypothetical protein J2T60_001749 [Natronospira proteinivora]|uniref:Uncharacterized protein n=1 Tax=Natronospira proteinivora TaxID=1807133 RepID=A0ABT1G8X2_9GAMM|nr:hypothetical protein [Natronospira proteinivora]